MEHWLRRSESYYLLGSLSCLLLNFILLGNGRTFWTTSKNGSRNQIFEPFLPPLQKTKHHRNRHDALGIKLFAIYFWLFYLNCNYFTTCKELVIYSWFFSEYLKQIFNPTVLTDWYTGKTSYGRFINLFDIPNKTRKGFIKALNEMALEIR